MKKVYVTVYKNYGSAVDRELLYVDRTPTEALKTTIEYYYPALKKAEIIKSKSVKSRVYVTSEDNNVIVQAQYD